MDDEVHPSIGLPVRSIDHRPVWLIIYDGVLLPMTDSEQTVLAILDPETGENSVQDLPYAPPASTAPD